VSVAAQRRRERERDLAEIFRSGSEGFRSAVVSDEDERERERERGQPSLRKKDTAGERTRKGEETKVIGRWEICRILIMSVYSSLRCFD
jgi:hypothetical protein